MLTWRLWLALGRPPYANPVFRYSVGQHPLRRRWLFAWLVITFVFACCSLSYIWPSIVQFLFYGPAGLLIIAPFVVSTIVGMILAGTISSAVTRTRENGLYAMLAIFPLGLLSSVWALGMGSLFRMRLYRLFRFLIAFLFAVMLLALLIEGGILFLIVLGGTADDVKLATLDALLTLTHILLAAWAIACEYVQSMIIGMMAGMATSTYTEDRLTARLGALGLFFALQLTAYFFTLTCWFGLLPLFEGLLPVRGWFLALVFALLRLMTLYFIREGLILWLWRLIAYRLDADPAERKHFNPERL